MCGGSASAADTARNGTVTRGQTRACSPVCVGLVKSWQPGLHLAASYWLCPACARTVYLTTAPTGHAFAPRSMASCEAPSFIFAVPVSASIS